MGFALNPERVGVRERVIFAGEVPRRQLPDHFALADAILGGLEGSQRPSMESVDRFKFSNFAAYLDALLQELHESAAITPQAGRVGAVNYFFDPADSKL